LSLAPNFKINDLDKSSELLFETSIAQRIGSLPISRPAPDARTIASVSNPVTPDQNHQTSAAASDCPQAAVLLSANFQD
jgi:hypothetical protein